MVTVIGEKINTASARVQAAVEGRNAQFIQDLALAQVESGAHVIDINVGSHPDKEPDSMRWAVLAVQDVVGLPLAVDSSNPVTVRAGLEVCNNSQEAWANSIALDRVRIEGLLPAVVEHGCRLVALCMDERGVPPTAEARLSVARRLADEVLGWGLSLDRLYLDPLVEPICLVQRGAITSLETIRAIGTELPEIRTIISLSAFSHGLPARRLLNRTLLPLLLEAGIDAVLVDPTDGELMSTLASARALLGVDPYGLEYISRYRSGLLRAT
jgi:5-methyltetrahydrofolate--homocysteine methyltransferase